MQSVGKNMKDKYQHGAGVTKWWDLFYKQFMYTLHLLFYSYSLYIFLYTAYDLFWLNIFSINIFIFCSKLFLLFSQTSFCRFASFGLFICLLTTYIKSIQRHIFHIHIVLGKFNLKSRWVCNVKYKSCFPFHFKFNEFAICIYFVGRGSYIILFISILFCMDSC